jgi:arsenate reductase
MNEKFQILFLCTGNSCRSQMAEGWTRHLNGDVLEPYSAGIDPKEIDPLAVRVMAEEGVDISGHRAKAIGDLPKIEFNYVVTVCDNAREMCPVYPEKTKMIHRSFDDPPALARAAADDSEVLRIYKRVRDEIRDFIAGLPEVLPPIQDS